MARLEEWKFVSVLMVLVLVVALGAAIVPASPVAAANISGAITYHPSGSVVGTYVPVSTNVVTFTPTANITAGSTITLTFPNGTTLANIVASDFTIHQVGGGTAAPSAIGFNPAARTITFTVAAGSLSPNGLGNVTIATSGTAGGNEIRHPTVATTTGAFSVATSVGDTGTINNVVFAVAAANKLKIVSAALNQNAGTQGTITVEVQDQYGNPQAAGAYTVNLASNSGGVHHFYTTGTQTVITSINIPGGASQGTFDYYDEKAGTPTVTVTDAGAVLTQDSQQQTINAAAANKLKIVSAALNQNAGTQGTITVEVQDQYGNPQAAGAYTVNLASNSGGVHHFYTTGTQTVITSINIPGGASQGTFDYYDEKAGTPTVTVTDAGAVLTQDNQQQTINPIGTATGTTASATGTGTVSITTSQGRITNVNAVAEATLTTTGKPAGVSFPHGLFSFTITGINIGSTVTVTITFPSPVAAGSQFWKCQGGTWVNVTSLVGDNDGDNVLTLTITDGGLGDADGVANGTIVDPGGPAAAVAPGTAGSSSPPMPMLSPARLSVKYLDVTPEQAQAGQPVTISANVVNDGDEAGNYSVVLKINGQVEKTRTVSVGPGTAYPVRFTVYRAEPGSYSVAIDGKQASFTILGAGGIIGSTGAGTLIAIIIIGILFIAGMVVLVRRFAR